MAPPVFLLIEKAVAATMGPSELALRLFPFLCGLFALVLFTKLSQEVLEGWAVPFAVGLFALGAPFIYFSSQVKQYRATPLRACSFCTSHCAFDANLQTCGAPSS